MARASRCGGSAEGEGCDFRKTLDFKVPAFVGQSSQQWCLESVSLLYILGMQASAVRPRLSDEIKLGFRVYRV